VTGNWMQCPVGATALLCGYRHGLHSRKLIPKTGRGKSNVALTPPFLRADTVHTKSSCASKISAKNLKISGNESFQGQRISKFWRMFLGNECW